ncbi:hypothetical protein NXH76_22720 [Blautia schinkii]|nr:hypothetical protein [Blautia schinkii]
MSEWNEDKLEKELEALVNEMPEQDDLEKKITEGINKRIRKIVLHTLAGVAAVVLAAFLVINPLMNKMFFDPYTLNKEPEQIMLGVLRDYCETTRPYREVIDLTVKKKGFARYELEMQVADLTEPLIVGPPNVWCEINFENYENFMDPDFNMTVHAGRFSDDYEEREEVIKKISELPKSAKIYLSLSDTSPKSIEELRDANVELEWFQVYQPNVDFQGGLSARPRAIYAEDDERDEMTEQELIEVYLSNLQNMLEYKEVWSQLQLSDGKGGVYYDQVLAKTYEDAKTLTTLTSKNYCVYAQRDEVIEFLQNNTFDSIYIDNVKLW